MLTQTFIWETTLVKRRLPESSTELYPTTNMENRLGTQRSCSLPFHYINATSFSCISCYSKHEIDLKDRIGTKLPAYHIRYPCFSTPFSFQAMQHKQILQRLSKVSNIPDWSSRTLSRTKRWKLLMRASGLVCSYRYINFNDSPIPSQTIFFGKLNKNCNSKFDHVRTIKRLQNAFFIL